MIRGNYIRTEKNKQLISDSLKSFYLKNKKNGYKHTEESKRKISEAQKRSYQKGRVPWSKGKKGLMPPNWNKGLKYKSPNISKALKGHKVSEEAKRKMSEVRKGKFLGEKSPTWIDGRSFFPYPSEFNQQLKNKIRKRDNYTCQSCGKLEGDELNDFNRRLAVHHIDYDKMNCKKENLTTLCDLCNSIVNSSRDYWTNYFKEKCHV